MTIDAHSALARPVVGGRENLCPNARITGWDHDGGYAEFATVREDFAYAIPDSIADEHAAPLLCAGIIGYRAIKRAGIGYGATVGLYGFGGSAHLALQVLKHWGCYVFAMSRGGIHQDFAAELGADRIGNSAEARPAPPMPQFCLLRPQILFRRS
jgi:alcohol dehydrogenase, propanol-preferring